MKVKELRKLLKTVDQDREVAYTDGMLINGIHGVVEDGARGYLDDVPNPVILSTLTPEEEFDELHLEMEMKKGWWEQQLEKTTKIKDLLEELVKIQDQEIKDLKETIEAPEIEE